MYRRVVKDVRLLEHECQWFKSGEKLKKATPFKPPSQPSGWWVERVPRARARFVVRW
jgi:hypothetical protein